MINPTNHPLSSLKIVERKGRTIRAVGQRKEEEKLSAQYFNMLLNHSYVISFKSFLERVRWWDPSDKKIQNGTVSIFRKYHIQTPKFC